MITCGVLQGSVLGPTVFTIYMSKGHIIHKHDISILCYTTDIQLDIKMDLTLASVLPFAFRACLKEIRAWMANNFLELSSIGEAIIIGKTH